MLFKQSDGVFLFNVLFAVVLSTAFRHNVHMNYYTVFRRTFLNLLTLMLSIRDLWHKYISCG